MLGMLLCLSFSVFHLKVLNIISKLPDYNISDSLIAQGTVFFKFFKVRIYRGV
jgi:hypothetical protein